MVMNLPATYKYSANVGPDGMYEKFDPDSTDGTLILNSDGEEENLSSAKMYSREWNGYYTKQDLDHLDNFYEQIEADFPLDDIIMQDSARKAAKAA